MTEPTFNPFPGLRPFRTEEDYLFFGREAQTAELVTLLRKHRLLAVVGTSGSGKSSLVRAGLLPEIQGGGMKQAGSAWEIAVLRPGGDPVRNLALALCAAELYDPDDAESLPRLLATLGHSSRGLVEAHGQSSVEEGENLLVVVDQFEEVFRFRKSDAESHDEARAFVNLLLEASRAEAPIYVVLTMRSDYLGDCSRFPGLAEAVTEGEYLIPRLGRDELRSAIEGPVRVGGGAIANRLVQRLLNDVGDDPDQLPILQHALMRAWDLWTEDRSGEEPIDLRHYEASGGMQEALSRHADEVYSALPDDCHRTFAGRLFKALTEKGADNRGTRRPARLAKLERITGADRGTVTTVIDAYRQPGVTFLVPAADVELRDETVVDLSHESLMRVWQRLRAWVEEEAQSARIFRRLAETAALWKQGRAGLYHDPDLQIARSWRDECTPNEAWASLYGGGFAEAMEFLERSREAAEAQEREREEARRRELARARELARTQSRAARNFKRFAGLVTVLAAIAVALSIWAFSLKRRAEENESRAEALRVQARHDLGTVWLERARLLLEEERHLPAKLLAARAVGFEGYGREEQDQAFRDAYPLLLRRESTEWKEVERLIRVEPEFPTIWQTPAGAVPEDVYCVAFSPRGDIVASAGDGGSMGGGGAVRLWDVASGDQVGVLDARSAAVQDLSFSPDGDTIAAASDDGTVRLLEVATSSETARLDHLTGVRAVRFSPDGTLLATGTRGRSIRLWEVEARREVARLEGHEGQLRSLEFDPDGTLLASGDSAGSIILWDLETRSEEGRLAGHTDDVEGLSFRSDGSQLVSASIDGTVRLWDVAGQNEIALLARFPGAARCAVFSPDGKRIATSRNSGKIQLWDASTRQEIGSLDGHQFAVSRIAFSPDGKLLVSGGRSDSTVRIWDLAELRERVSRGGGHLGDVRGLCFSPDGRTLASASIDSTVALWDISSGEQLARLDTPSLLSSVAFTPDGATLVSGAYFNGGVRLWDVATLQESRLIQSGATSRVAVSPRGGVLAYGGQDGTVHLQDLATGEETELRGHSGRIHNISFSPDGATLASCGSDGTVRLWNLSAGRETAVIAAHPDTLDVRFSPAGGIMATSGDDGVIRLYDLTAPEPVPLDPALEGHAGAVNSVSFSPDGARLASAGNDGTVRLWDVASRKLLAVLEGHSAPVLFVAFSPDGRTLASASEDHSVRLWEVAQAQIAVFGGERERHIGVRFSPDGSSIATGGEGGAKILDALTGAQRARLEVPRGHGQFVQTVEFSPDGARLATACTGGSLGTAWVCVWDVPGGTRRAIFAGIPGLNPGLAFSPDSALLAAPATDGRLRVWDVAGSRTRVWLRERSQPWCAAFSADGAMLAIGCADGSIALRGAAGAEFEATGRLQGHGGAVSRLRFRPGGELLASGGTDGEIRLWNMASRKPLGALAGHAPGFVGLAFSPDGATLASVSSGDQTVRFWDVDSRVELATLRGHGSGALFDIDFSPDGEVVASGGWDNTIRLWDARSRVGPTSRYAAYLERFRIDGRHVRAAGLRNLYREERIPLAPVSAMTHLSLLRRKASPAEIDRALFWQFLRARNWPSAAFVLERLSSENAKRERQGFVALLVEDARALVTRGLFRLALARLESTTEFASKADLPRIASVRAAALARGGRMEEAHAAIEEGIRLARELGDAGRSQLESLAVQRLRLHLDARELDATRDDLEALVGLRGYDAALLDEYLSARVEEAQAKGPPERARLTLIAAALLELHARTLESSRVDRAKLKQLNEFARQEAGKSLVLIEPGSSWRHLPEGAELPSAWRDPGFDDSSWPAGLAPFGFGDPGRAATTLVKGRMAYHFRHSFAVRRSEVPAGAELVLTFVRDDGIVLYLNGKELLRDNMPVGAIDPTTPSVTSIGTDAEETREHVVAVDAVGRLLDGANVLAAEVHQRGLGSSDLFFELGVEVKRTTGSQLAEIDRQTLDHALGLAAFLLPAPLQREWGPAMRFAHLGPPGDADPLAADPRAWRLRGRLQRVLGNHVATLEALERELALIASSESPEDVSRYDEAHLELTTLLRTLGRVDEAAERERAWALHELEKRGEIRINCGGDHYLTPAGVAWRGDRFFDGGATWLEGPGNEFWAEIEKTEDDPLYQTERWFSTRQGPLPAYRIPVPPGRYRVTLHFAEMLYFNPKQRVFDVHIEGDPELGLYDIVRTVGFAAADVKHFEVEVKDNRLDIEFIHVTGNPKISAIEVEPTR